MVEKDNGGKDERGQLFYRIIDILREHPECKYIILENVRNLADKDENWTIICRELKNPLKLCERWISSFTQFCLPYEVVCS